MVEEQVLLRWLTIFQERIEALERRMEALERLHNPEKKLSEWNVNYEEASGG